MSSPVDSPKETERTRPVARGRGRGLNTATVLMSPGGLKTTTASYEDADRTATDRDKDQVLFQGVQSAQSAPRGFGRGRGRRDSKLLDQFNVEPSSSAQGCTNEGVEPTSLDLAPNPESHDRYTLESHTPSCGATSDYHTENTDVPRIPSPQSQFSGSPKFLSQEFEDNPEEHAVEVEISNLPPDVTDTEIQSYFEGQLEGENAEVLSAAIISEGNASVKLAGLTTEELDKLQRKRHRIRKRTFQVTVSKIVMNDEWLNDSIHSQTPPPMEVDTIVVTNVPTTCDEEFLTMYFENPQKSNGLPDSVESCTIAVPGTAHVKFTSPLVASKVLEREKHVIKGQRLQLEYEAPILSPLPEKNSGLIELNKLVLHKIPAESVDSEFLSLFVCNQLRIEDEEFSLTMVEDSAVIEFRTQYTCEELNDMIQKLQSKPIKGVCIDAQLCTVCATIRISGVTLTKHYDEEFIQLYFENASKSGGGKVTRIEMLGNGEANVTFEDPKVIPNVLGKNHNASFGESVEVNKHDVFQVNENTSESGSAMKESEGNEASVSKTSTELQTLEIKVDPLIAKCIENDTSSLVNTIKDLNVTFKISSKEGKIIVASSKSSKAGWQNDAQEKITAYLSENFIAKHRMRVHKDGMQELIAHLSNTRNEVILEYLLSSDGKTLSVAGSHHVVNGIEMKTDEIFNKHQVTTVLVSGLTQKDFKFFFHVKQTQVKQTFPRVSCQMHANNSTLSLYGTVQDTNLLKSQLKEILFHETIKVSLDPLVVMYFNTKHGEKKLEEVIKQNSNQVTSFITSNESDTMSLELLCDPNESSLAPTISEAISQLSDIKNIKLSESFNLVLASKSGVVSREYKTLCESLRSKNNVAINCSETKVSLAGISENVNQSVQELTQFIKAKTSSTLTTKLDKGEWRLLDTHMQVKFELFLSKCMSVDVEFVKPTEIDEPSILLKGDLLKVQVMAGELSELRQSICKSTVPIERPGTRKILLSENTRYIFDGLEMKNKVAIEVTEPVDDEIGSSGPNQVNDVSDHKRVCVASVKSKQIVIYTGDITEFPTAEVIVNAANGDLNHMGGVASAISNKGGPVIQQESNQRIRRGGRLSPGDVWITKAVGKLPCKALVHAVGPVWSGGWNKEEALLAKACRESLYAAKRYKSILFPAISSGIYGFPVDKCAETMIKAIIAFCDKNAMSDLRDIGIILPHSKISECAQFIKVLQMQLGKECVHTDQGSGGEEYEPVEEISPAPKVYATRTPKPKKTVSKKSPSVSSDVLSRIKLQRGGLLSVKADVYVNTTNNKLDLSQGAVSQALLKAGGQDLQSECDEQSPVQTGEIGVTGPGNLPCNYVFHTVIPSYNGGQGEETLKLSVHKCLQQCSTLKEATIAFPAIGTGNLGYPNEVVARIMIQAVYDFLSSNKHTSISLVYLVIFMEKTYKAFQRELKGLSSDPKQSSGQGGFETVPQNGATPTSFKGYGRRNRSVPATGREDSTTSSQEEKVFKIGCLKVTVINGDIAEESSDIVVNPTNSTLQLVGHGVAGALLRKGGPELQQLCDTAKMNIGKPLEGENVVVTPKAGKLKCKLLFHINFESNDGKKFARLIVNCLRNAEDRKCTSISFPAIGTGTHGYAPRDAVAGIMKAIEQFSSTNPKHVKSIRVVLFQTSVYQQFLEAFRNPAQPGLVEKFWNYGLSKAPTWKSEEPVESHYMETESDIFRELRVSIYGTNKKSVETVEADIWSIIEKNFTTELVDDPNVDKLSKSEVQKLKKNGEELHVQIDIDGAPLNRIRLRGDKADVYQMKGYVIELFAEFEKNEFEKREAEQEQLAAEHVYQLIRWKRMDSSGPEYDVEVNYKIEMAFKSKESNFTYKDDEEHFTIDFNQCQEIDHKKGNAIVKVERCDLVEQLRQGERPKTWEPMPIDPSTNKESTLHIADLKPTSSEYQKVTTKFDISMVPATSAPTRLNPQPGVTSGAKTAYNSVIKIQRIQNPTLYSQYIARKKEVDKRYPDGKQIISERQLFHGTSVITCPKINSGGFNRSYAGRNATVFGKGVYFARDASYSARDTYSPRDAQGYKYIYLARVITGEFTVANGSMLEAPDNPNFSNTKYDCAVDNIQNPQIFVVFQDAVVYPEYLITFN